MMSGSRLGSGASGASGFSTQRVGAGAAGTYAQPATNSNASRFAPVNQVAVPQDDSGFVEEPAAYGSTALAQNMQIARATSTKAPGGTSKTLVVGGGIVALLVVGGVAWWAFK